MKLVKFYLATRIYKSTILVFLILLLLFAFFDFIQELSELEKEKYGILDAAIHVFLRLPSRSYEIIPVSTLIGSLFALSSMVINSEFLVLRTAGISLRKIASMLIQVGLILTFVTFTIGELIAPICDKTAQRLRLTTTQSNVIAKAFKSGLWVKDGNNLVNVGRIMPTTRMHEIKIYQFDSDYNLRSIIKAKKGEYQKENIWKLLDVEQINLDEKQMNKSKFSELMWFTVLDPSILDILMVVPEQMSIWELFFYVRYLKSNSQDSSRYEMAFYQKIIYPFAVLMMLVIALTFSNFYSRGKTISFQIFAGIMIGIVFHLGNRLFGHIGLLHSWHPILGAILPSLFFLGLAIYFLEKQEIR